MPKVAGSQIARSESRQSFVTLEGGFSADAWAVWGCDGAGDGAGAQRVQAVAPCHEHTTHELCPGPRSSQGKAAMWGEGAVRNPKAALGGSGWLGKLVVSSVFIVAGSK